MSAQIARLIAEKLEGGTPSADDLKVAAALLREFALHLEAPPAGYAVHLPGRVPDRALFIDHGRAEAFAAQHHGTITPMVDAWPNS